MRNIGDIVTFLFNGHISEIVHTKKGKKIIVKGSPWVSGWYRDFEEGMKISDKVCYKVSGYIHSINEMEDGSFTYIVEGTFNDNQYLLFLGVTEYNFKECE